MEYQTLKTVLNFLKMVIILLGGSLAAFILTGQGVVGNEGEQVSYALQVAYIAVGLCGGAAILFTIYQFIVNFKQSIPALAGVGVFSFILLIAYNMASTYGVDQYEVSAGQSQVIGGGIIAIYVFLGLAIISIIVSEVARIIKGSKS